MQYWQPMQLSARWLTMPLSSFTYAFVGHPERQVGSRHWLQDIDMLKRATVGNEPASTSPTLRQFTSSGLPFCSAQATSHEWQPTQAPMSNAKRYCSPASRGS